MNDLYNDSLEEDRRKESRKHTIFDNPMDFVSEFEEMFNNFFKGFPAMAFPLPNGTVFFHRDTQSAQSSDRLQFSGHQYKVYRFLTLG